MIGFIQGNGLPGILAIRQKVDGNIVWTLAILIVVVVPCFGDTDACLAWNMRIGHIGSIIACAVICDRIFFHRVGNFRTVLIFRQVTECPAPVIGSGDFLALYFLTVGKQADRYALRPYAVLVVVIIPRLCAAH